MSRGGTTLLKTYILRLHHGAEEAAALQPVLCKTDAQALAKAREWLAQHPDCLAIDVLCGTDELYHVGRPG